MSATSPVLDATRTALLIVDVQNGFVTDETAQIVPAIARLLEGPATRLDLVVATRFVNRPGSPYERFMDWRALSSSPDIDLHPAILSRLGRNATVLDKSGYSAYGSEMRVLLFRLGIDTVLLCGIDTEGCVLASAIALFDAGYRPVMLADLCASTGGPAHHEAGLLVARRLLGAAQILGSDALEDD